MRAVRRNKAGLQTWNKREVGMAADQTRSTGSPDMDYPEHERTYQLFLWLLKNGTIAVVSILVILALIWG